MMTYTTQLLDDDRRYLWHPYSAIETDQAIFPVQSAQGVKIKLTDGRELIDGMASWWSAIHGYNHPVINQALIDQVQSLSHIMFGGLTHQPAVELGKRLIDLTPDNLQKVFFVDSGSVAVEVALKMAIQYWSAYQRPDKQKMLTIRYGYHGDTFGAMSVSDPDNGMHYLFSKTLNQQYFVPAPSCRWGQAHQPADIDALTQQLDQHHGQIAAIILEPIVQGAGGMRFYSADYLKQVHQLCQHYQILLIVDEIATGFGRTGKLFACEHAGIEPDILCLGKALTGGYMTLAATLTSQAVAETISQGEPGVFMHGPTFMANPLACRTALASTQLLLDTPWQQRIQQIELQLKAGLSVCQNLAIVKEVRVLGAIGVIELYQPVDMVTLPRLFVEAGVWVRPFNHLIYLMPPYIIEVEELEYLMDAVRKVVATIPNDC